MEAAAVLQTVCAELTRDSVECISVAGQKSPAGASRPPSVILATLWVEIPRLLLSSAPSAEDIYRLLSTAESDGGKKTKQKRRPSSPRLTMDLHRTSILNQMDYSRESKEGKPSQATDERLDSGLDSLREEEYQAVAAEFHRLRVECEPPPHKQAPAATGELHEWKTQVTEDGDT